MKHSRDEWHLLFLHFYFQRTCECGHFMNESKDSQGQSPATDLSVRYKGNIADTLNRSLVIIPSTVHVLSRQYLRVCLGNYFSQEKIRTCNHFLALANKFQSISSLSSSLPKSGLSIFQWFRRKLFHLYIENTCSMTKSYYFSQWIQSIFLRTNKTRINMWLKYLKYSYILKIHLSNTNNVSWAYFKGLRCGTRAAKPTTQDTSPLCMTPFTARTVCAN